MLAFEIRLFSDTWPDILHSFNITWESWVCNYVIEHDLDAIIRHLNETTCTIDIGEQCGKCKNNEYQLYLEATR